MGENMSPADVAAVVDGNRGYGYGGNFFGGDSGFFWVFALLLLNNGAFGGRGGAGGPGFVTSADLNASQNAQTNQLMLSNIQSQIADNRYDVAEAINTQTNTLLQQNNTNLINAIQGFNNLGSQITNQTNVLSQQIQSLSAQMQQCCCDIKTQMLQDRLTDTQARLVTAQNAIDNANQSQYILGQLGRFVAWAGSGSQSATAAA